MSLNLRAIFYLWATVSVNQYSKTCFPNKKQVASNEHTKARQAMSSGHRLLLFSFLLLSLISTTTQADTYWDLDSISQSSLSNDSSIDLTNGSRTVTKLSTSQIRMLLETRDRITAQSGSYAKVLISDMPMINAFANSSNGANTVTVTLEMLEMLGNDSDQCAALMGHEITHILKNHMAQKVAVNTILNLLGAIAAAALDEKLKNTRGAYQGLGNDLASIGTGLGSSAFSRDEEREADTDGFKWMTMAGYDPQGALRLHKGLLNHSGDNNSFFSTHPSSSERIANINQMIAQYESTKSIKVASYAPPQPVTSQAPENQNTKSIAAPSIDISGQVGVVLTLKSRYNYVILSGTTATMLPVGLNVNVVTSDNKRIPARIARALDGYYSAIIDGDIYHISQGDKIEVKD